jgi:excisionase family DNA binding protein
MKSTKTSSPGASDQAEHLAQVERRTISVEEAGRILGVSRGAAYAYARDGSIPTIRLGKRLLVPKAAIEKMLNVASEIEDWLSRNLQHRATKPAQPDAA